MVICFTCDRSDSLFTDIENQFGLSATVLACVRSICVDGWWKLEAYRRELKREAYELVELCVWTLKAAPEVKATDPVDISTPAYTVCLRTSAGVWWQARAAIV